MRDFRFDSCFVCAEVQGKNGQFNSKLLTGGVLSNGLISMRVIIDRITAEKPPNCISLWLVARRN